MQSTLLIAGIRLRALACSIRTLAIGSRVTRSLIPLRDGEQHGSARRKVVRDFSRQECRHARPTKVGDYFRASLSRSHWGIGIIPSPTRDTTAEDVGAFLATRRRNHFVTEIDRSRKNFFGSLPSGMSTESVNSLRDTVWG